MMLLIGCGAGLAFSFMLCLFGCFSTNTSTFDLWLKQRGQIKLAELEVRKLEAQHARICPRLTDTPRTRSISE